VTRRARYRRRGYTLIELLVVIGIIVILLGITVPVGMRLQAGNRLMACEANLHKIHQALRTYRLEEGGFPPYWYEPGTTTLHGRGLLALVDMGYIQTPRILECPLDDHESYDLTGVTIDASPAYTAEDPISYQLWSADDVSVADQLPLRYSSDRGLATGDRDYDRVPRDGQGTLYQPDDTTVLTYCPFHRKTITKGGRPQYLVLFYDGHVEQMDEDLFRDGDVGTTPPEEGWRAWPGQAAWNGGAPEY